MVVHKLEGMQAVCKNTQLQIHYVWMNREKDKQDMFC